MQYCVYAAHTSFMYSVHDQLIDAHAQQMFKTLCWHLRLCGAKQAGVSQCLWCV